MTALTTVLVLSYTLSTYIYGWFIGKIVLRVAVNNKEMFVGWCLLLIAPISLPTVLFYLFVLRRGQ